MQLDPILVCRKFLFCGNYEKGVKRGEWPRYSKLYSVSHGPHNSIKALEITDLSSTM